MGNRGVLGNRLRERLRAERERRGWTQAHMAMLLSHDAGDGVIATTVAKIEAGDREVRIVELDAYAQLFGMTTDALLGRRGSGADAVWAASKLSSNAHKMVGEMLSLRQRLEDDQVDLEQCAERGKRAQSMEDLITAADNARNRIEDARIALAALASEFPLPGMK